MVFYFYNQAENKKSFGKPRTRFSMFCVSPWLAKLVKESKRSRRIDLLVFIHR